MTDRPDELTIENLGVPTVLPTVGAQGSVLLDPTFSQISEISTEPARQAA